MQKANLNPAITYRPKETSEIKDNSLAAKKNAARVSGKMLSLKLRAKVLKIGRNPKGLSPNHQNFEVPG